MKKLITLLLPLLLLCSCEFNGSHNGDLDGFWMLTRIDTLCSQQSLQCREQLLFWSFQADMMKTQQLADEAPDKTIYLYRFNHTGNSLEVYEPVEYNRMEGNEPISGERLDELKRFGINQKEENFQVKELNSKHMQLQTEALLLHFEKY